MIKSVLTDIETVYFMSSCFTLSSIGNCGPVSGLKIRPAKITNHRKKRNSKPNPLKVPRPSIGPGGLVKFNYERYLSSSWMFYCRVVWRGGRPHSGSVWGEFKETQWVFAHPPVSNEISCVSRRPQRTWRSAIDRLSLKTIKSIYNGMQGRIQDFRKGGSG